MKMNKILLAVNVIQSLILEIMHKVQVFLVKTICDPLHIINLVSVATALICIGGSLGNLCQHVGQMNRDTHLFLDNLPSAQVQLHGLIKQHEAYII